jgi:HK97 family phage portal protein
MSPDTADYFGYPQSASGVAVDERLALGYAAVYACVRVLSECVAQLPIGVYRHLDRGKQAERRHPAHRLLNVAPNPEMGAFTFRETLTSHVCTWGNGYAEIERTGRGAPTALHPLRPDRVTPKRIAGRLAYEVRRDDGAQRDLLDASDVLHIAGLGYDGLKGYSPIRMHRNAIGHGMAQETYSARFFGNGSTPGGVIEYTGALDEVSMRKFRQSWESMHAGPDASHRVAILDGGAKFNPIGISPEDSQLLEARKFSVTEIARIFRVPPHMIGDLERATFSNIEQQSIDFLTYSLLPWLVRWEQEVNRKLFMPGETDYFAQHMTGKLLRGDTLARYQAYAVARQWGWLSANDVREEENMNPLPDDEGEIYLTPMNMTPADEVQSPKSKVQSPKSPQAA